MAIRGGLTKHAAEYMIYLRTHRLPFRTATRDEITQSLSFALRFNGRKRAHDADETMARITAERLVEHLERSDIRSCTSRR